MIVALEHEVTAVLLWSLCTGPAHLLREQDGPNGRKLLPHCGHDHLQPGGHSRSVHATHRRRGQLPGPQKWDPARKLAQPETHMMGSETLHEQQDSQWTHVPGFDCRRSGALAQPLDLSLECTGACSASSFSGAMGLCRCPPVVLEPAVARIGHGTKPR